MIMNKINRANPLYLIDNRNLCPNASNTNQTNAIKNS